MFDTEHISRKSDNGSQTIRSEQYSRLMVVPQLGRQLVGRYVMRV